MINDWYSKYTKDYMIDADWYSWLMPFLVMVAAA